MDERPPSVAESELPSRAGRRPTTPPVVVVLLALNVVVFLLWRAGFRNEWLLDLMKTHFAVSALHLSKGYLWTLLTAAFSQFELWHLLFNMIVLWSFGGPLAKILGWRVFLLFYLATSVFSSASHCFVSAVLMGQANVAALGASGAMSGLLLMYALLFPRHRILLFMVIPIPAIVGVIVFIALDIWGLVAQTGGGGLPIGHGAHLGGSLCGAVMYLVYLRPRLEALRTARRERAAAITVALTPEEAAEFDRIRIKLGHHGPSALNPKEKDFLRRIRERAMADE
jgi:membrane associated rhomboid family serine protease